MLHSIEMGWFLINKYYELSDQAPVYATALLLDPTKRSAYIKQNWQKDWIQPAIAAANTIWERDYKEALPEPSAAVPDIELPDAVEPLVGLDRLLNEVEVRSVISVELDDFMTFASASPIKLEKGITPLQWWCRIEQRQQYPRLSRMAIAILSIPAESSEPERTFSGARTAHGIGFVFRVVLLRRLSV